MKNKAYLVWFIIPFFLSYFGIINFKKIGDLLKKKRVHLYVPAPKVRNMYEIDLIYIGSSTCKFSNSNDLYRSVDGAKLLIYNKAVKYNMGFTTIGIAVDRDPAKGIKHLEKFGFFDEVLSGNGWSNSGILKYVGEKGIEASTPQLLVVYRTYPKNIKTNIESEKQVLDLKGEREIINWYKKGAPLPQKFVQEIQQQNEITS